MPIWSEELQAAPREGTCIDFIRFGNILALSVPVIVRTSGASQNPTIYLRHRVSDSGPWGDAQQIDAEPGQTDVTFDLTGLRPATEYEVQASVDPSFPQNNSYRRRFTTGYAPEIGDITSGARARILRIEPSITSVSVGPGDTVNLSVDVFGRQNIHDNGLADRAPQDGRPTFNWQAQFVSFKEANIRSEWRNGIADDREVTVVAPDAPGTYDISVGFSNPNVCLGARDGESEQDHIDRCTASFQLTVRRSSVVQIVEIAPVNPKGTIPETLSDSEGTAYAVFTPEDGGVFTGEGIEFSAGPGAVKNNEYIGISVTDIGDASNAGQTHHRYTMAGFKYAVKIIDDSGESATDYTLSEPATVCLPLPDEFRTRIDRLVILSTDDSGALTILSSTAKITPEGVIVCGKISTLPAIVAVGTQGAPASIPVETPQREVSQTLPDTGGPTPGALALLSLILLGTTITAFSIACLKHNAFR